jgi:hypothetical protein
MNASPMLYVSATQTTQSKSLHQIYNQDKLALNSCSTVATSGKLTLDPCYRHAEYPNPIAGAQIGGGSIASKPLGCARLERMPAGFAGRAARATG